MYTNNILKWTIIPQLENIYYERRSIFDLKVSIQTAAPNFVRSFKIFQANSFVS